MIGNQEKIILQSFFSSLVEFHFLWFLQKAHQVFCRRQKYTYFKKAALTNRNDILCVEGDKESNKNHSSVIFFFLAEFYFWWFLQRAHEGFCRRQKYRYFKKVVLADKNDFLCVEGDRESRKIHSSVIFVFFGGISFLMIFAESSWGLLQKAKIYIFQKSGID